MSPWPERPGVSRSAKPLAAAELRPRVAGSQRFLRGLNMFKIGRIVGNWPSNYMEFKMKMGDGIS